MKTIRKIFRSIVLLCIFSSCSNHAQEKEEFFEDFSQILAESEPYISPKMKEIMHMFDTATVALPLEKVMPFINSLQDTLIDSNKITRVQEADGTSVVYGYSKKTTLFNRKQVKLSSDSPLLSSLDYPSGESQTAYITCLAIDYYLYFSDYTEVYPSVKEYDRIGVDPDKIEGDISNDSYLVKGYYCDEKKKVIYTI